MQNPQLLALNRAAENLPPHTWFGVSAIFHYLGPAFAVLLFPAIGILGIAWFRIATAALVFAPLTNPWRTFCRANNKTKLLLIALGGCLAVMNTSFYLALDRLPMSLVAAMEFAGILGVALYGVRSLRNLLAFGLVVIGVSFLIDIEWKNDLVGLFWSMLNAALFSVYVILGHKASNNGAGGGVELLGTAMAIAFVLLLPIGLSEAAAAFGSPTLVLAAIGVGICSSVIPYVCDQLAMSRLPRPTFALMLSFLPAIATLIAAIVLAQIPTAIDLLGIALVMGGVAMHTPKEFSLETNRKSKDEGKANAI